MSEVAKIEPAAPAPVIQGESGALISMIERAARDPSVDIDKMERLFQMHERVEARQREAAFNEAMALAQAEIKPVARNKRNTQTSSNYADLAAVSDAIDPIIHSHGLAVVCSEIPSPKDGFQGIRCNVKHRGGHSETHDFFIPIDAAGIQGRVNKTATHAYGSTFAYGRRYAKCAVFDVATKDVDGNQPSGVISDEQADELRDLIGKTKTDIDEFLRLGEVESLSDIPARQFDKAKALLVAKLNKMGKP